MSLVKHTRLEVYEAAPELLLNPALEVLSTLALSVEYLTVIGQKYMLASLLKVVKEIHSHVVIGITMCALLITCW